MASSVARWLSPKPARSCHEKLGAAKNHLTNFQLKSAKNSEILLKKTALFEVFKINLQSSVSIFGLALIINRLVITLPGVTEPLRKIMCVMG